MTRTREEIIKAKMFLRFIAIQYGKDFPDELNLFQAALDEVNIIEEHESNN
jgi:hypothetical protein